MGAAGLVLVRPAERTRAGTASRAPVRLRIIDAALACLARQGIAKTTLDDVARETRCSRATIYRAFPGGKDSLLVAVGETELARFYGALALHLVDAEDLEDVLVEAMAEGASRIAHHPTLGYLLEHEPGVVVPFLAFSRMDELLAGAAAFLAPFLGRFVDLDEAIRLSEFATRLVLSYLSCPAQGIDITDRDDVRALVRRFVLPGVAAGVGESPGGRPVASPPTTPRRPDRKGEMS
jgi:AcrR family transcriptional regulator